MNITRGKFITLEGVDGSGKSSHIQWLTDKLKDYGINVINTREPGGTPLAEDLRTLVLNKPMSIEAEALLMFAARKEHIINVIEPALARGDWVISDRFTDSSFAYQGGGRGLDIMFLNTLENLIVKNLQPDTTFLFDLPVEVAQSRIGNRELDKFEAETLTFHNNVRQMYLKRSTAFPDRFFTINAQHTIEDIRVLLLGLLNQRYNLV